MKKKFLSFILAIFLSMPCFALIGCNKGGNPDGDGGQDLTVQQVFSKFENVQDCMTRYEGTLSIDIVSQNFSGESKEQMNTPGHWCETNTGHKGYNQNTGEFYAYDVYGTNVWTSYVSKTFTDDQIGFFEWEEGILVDKAFGAHIIKEGVLKPYKDSDFDYTIFKNDILGGGIYDFTSYLNYIKAFEEFKSEKAAEYDMITYSINNKKQNDNYIIEASLIVEQNDDADSSAMKLERIYRYTFEEDFLLKFEKIEESTEYGYSYKNETYIFEKSFSQEECNTIDTSSYQLPVNKITQTLNVYRDCVGGVRYEMEFGTSISDCIDGISPKAHTKGFIAYIDAEHTIPLTNELTKSYEPTNVYLLSIPEDDYAVAITRYIYEKTNGEREYEVVTSSVDCIVDYSIPDEPWVFKRYEFYDKVVNAQSKFYHEEFYVNGQPADLQYDVRESGVYYFDLVHKQDKSPTVVNIYDSCTDKVWKSYTYYENGTAWPYIKAEILANEEYCGIPFDEDISVRFFQDDVDITDYQYLYVENGQLDVYLSVSCPSATNMFRYIDLTDDSVVARIIFYDLNFNEPKVFDLNDFETLIINGIEFKKNGAIGNMENITSEFGYDEDTLSLSVALEGGTFNIKFKTKAGSNIEVYY